ncbi:MAG: hypothetical protein H5U19_04665 [Rhodobacteraceae bacterium]|nr:hypothetical protein [Paracoccaceae bacterium]
MTSDANLPGSRESRIFRRFFWGTIIILAVALLALVAIAFLRAGQQSVDRSAGTSGFVEDVAPPVVEIEPTRLQKYFERAAADAGESTSAEIDELLDILYDPVYGGIESYVDFHYSVLGEYTELAGAALGTSADAIESKLFGGFPERMEHLGNSIDARFAEALTSALQRELQAEMPEGLSEIPLGPTTQQAIDDTIARVSITAPVGTFMAVFGGVAGIKSISAGIAARVATRVAVKAGAKGVAKGSGILGGAGLGALGGSWAGPPGAAVGGIIGATVTWLAVDAAVINIDEYFNREDFEADLRVMVDEHRDEVRQNLVMALEQKKADTLMNFTLRDRSRE